MKKILVIHNKYQNIGGEDISVSNELKYLKKYFETEVLNFDNNLKISLLQIIYLFLGRNYKSKIIVKNKIKNFKPDIIYIHNTWFKASISVFSAFKKFKGKKILKLHNFRYDCTRQFLTKNHLGNDSMCERCGQTKTELGYFNKYFNNSHLKSFAVKIYGKQYYRILKQGIFDLHVLTQFHKDYLINNGIDATKIYVFPNQFDKFEENCREKIDKYFVYAGRISNEKGIEDLIHAFLNTKNKEYKLKIIGNGPQFKYLKSKYESNQINFMGEISNFEVISIICNSKAVVSGTKLYEGQPTLLCEASLNGVVSIFPNNGGIKEFLPKNYKYLYQKGNFVDLTEKINLLINEVDENVFKQGNENRNYLINYLENNEF